MHQLATAALVILLLVLLVGIEIGLVFFPWLPTARRSFVAVREAPHAVLRRVAAPTFVLGASFSAFGATVFLVVAIWVHSAPSSRSDLVSELTLAGTVLGFAVAFLALVSATEQVRRASTPPAIVARYSSESSAPRVNVQIPPRIADDYYAGAPSIAIENEGPGSCLINRVVARHSIVIKTSEGAAYMFRHGLTMTPVVREDDVWDMSWSPTGDGRWELKEPFTLDEGDTFEMQPFVLETAELESVTALLAPPYGLTRAWRVALTIHTQRSSVRYLLDLPIRAVDVWSDEFDG